MRGRAVEALVRPMKQQITPRKAIQLLKKNSVDNCPQTKEILSNKTNFIFHPILNNTRVFLRILS